MSFTIEFDDEETRIPVGCTVTVVRYSVTDRGGPDRADLSISGSQVSLWHLTNWVGKRIRIVNQTGSVVWFGLVSELVMGFGAFSVGASLLEMANRIEVIYSELDATGSSSQQMTGWLGDADSQSQFGVKELRFSAGEVSDSQALAKQAELLAGLAWPVGSPTLTPVNGASVKCIGLMQTLEWKYFSNLLGRIENIVSDGGSIGVGWRLTSTDIGFYEVEGVFHIGDKIGGVVAGDSIVVSGSVSNNRAFTVASKTSGVDVYTATTIHFDNGDGIFDTANGLRVFSANEYLLVSGSVSNNGFHYVQGVTEGNIDTYGGMRATVLEAAGASITLTQGARIVVDEAVVNGIPGSSVTITLVGYILAQSFVPVTTMVAGKVCIRVGAEGSPADSLSVSICSDSAGSPGASLGTGSVVGSAIGDGQEEVWIVMPAITLTAGVTYWLKVDRTGATDPENYYSVALSETPYGVTKAWNGSAWVSFVQSEIAKSLVFRVWDTEDTAVSMARIVAACGQGFVTGVLMSNTGVKRCQYTDNDSTGLAEIAKLIGLGASGGVRLICDIDEAGLLTVTGELSANYVNVEQLPVLHQDGKLLDFSGSPWDEGRLPVGQWVRLAGVPDELNAAWRISPIFVQAASYEVKSRRMNLTPRSARNLLTFFQNG